MANLDPIDCAILDIVQREARESFTRIGHAIGLSSNSVADRLRRMEREGMLSGYHAHIVPSKVGFGITAFLLARSTGSDARFRGAIQSKLEIVECYRVTGEVSFVLRAVLTGVEHLEELIDYLEETSYITTLIVLSNALDRYGLPLQQLGQDELSP